MISEAVLMDNMKYMAQFPDKFFDLAVVDPEFGIGIAKSRRLVIDKGHKAKDWDDSPAPMEYFVELFRVSKNQIIFGGEYYDLPSCKHSFIWDKIQPEQLSFGMYDYAWTSFDKPNKIYRRSIKLDTEKRINPTQKPIQLYQWIFYNYLPNGGKVIDTNLGSGSSRIAADMQNNIDFYSCEICKDQITLQEKRYKDYKKQLVLTF